MGRQINFYVDRQTELEILDFIKREGGKFMFDQSGEIVFSDDFDKFRSARNGWLKCHFTKDGFALPKIERVFNKHMGREFDHCSVSRCEIIEFDGGVVNLPDKKARSGRVYMMSDYYDEAGELVKKGENFIKFYERLVRFIKKLAPRREVKAGGCTFKIYVSDRVFELYRGGEIVKILLNLRGRSVSGSVKSRAAKFKAAALKNFNGELYKRTILLNFRGKFY